MTDNSIAQELLTAIFKDGQTALMHAIKYGRGTIVEELQRLSYR